ncbi:ATP-binding cassette domain-containing protein [Actinomadura sp. HBU206391]|uniref:ATP-binding cassette domain-containing protein n=1 Tax=Actinomadura sp. HBU206391 TaxID=2731692 RepID=UPI0016508AD3|nr:ATP-binding cassette domain-containing protein [Actinomadura sp. HBU206391]MBC6460170.1 ATP-binding cassette domain-containing protein [Actinomadura sp. HBU206391]
MIELRGLTKRFGATSAVQDLTLTVEPGVVTGFLGPNGAGKTTTMRMILGLAAPTSGTVLVNGRRYADLPSPMREVGALLDARAVHGGRTAYAHLLCLAHSNGIARRRVDDVLGIVGLEKVAGKRIGAFSLGMSQRLGIAAALLGDPASLMFDEPVNGLDPEGVMWIRHLMRDLAREGRTVLVSSHLMTEMSLTADHLIVIGRGRLIANTGVEAFMRAHSRPSVRVRTSSAGALARLLTDAGAHVRPGEGDVLVVSDLDSTEIGKVAAAEGLVLSELTPQRSSLEEVFMELTRDCVEYATEGELR